MKKIVQNLLFKVFIGIILGILFGKYAPEWFLRALLTFKDLFGNFLGFAIPLIIIGLVMPSIAELGKNAGRLLLITIGIAYTFTLFSGFSTFFVGEVIFPSLLQNEHLNSISEEGKNLTPFFRVEMPPIADVMSALLLAFITGIGLSVKGKSSLFEVVKDFGEIVSWFISKAIIPVLPFYILSIFAEITFSGKVVAIMEVFFKLIGIIFIMNILLLVIQFMVAGGIAKRNPFRTLWTMLPAYATALGTQSSAATIPVTLRQTIKMGVSERIAGFVIPLCATIHLSGSTMKITACAMALMLLEGIPYDLHLFSGFIMMLGVIMVAAPGVPGGGIMAALGVLQSILGFDEAQQGLMIALYMAMDSFGTACNVTGDGAVALIVDKIEKK
ncbi:MAG: dicarboxylate/amino acid:cation symporter [Capnocytophaga sp.]|nr:dicarboxylate/amino acid:cation symporter [Capnocytophaga sp.]